MHGLHLPVWFKGRNQVEDSKSQLMHCPYPYFLKSTISENAQVTTDTIFETNEDFEFLLAFPVVQIFMVVGSHTTNGE